MAGGSRGTGREIEPDHAGPRRLLLAVVLLAPLPFGSNHPLALLILQVVAATVWLGVVWQRRGAGYPLQAPLALTIPVLAWIALAIAQLVPVPVVWHGLLAPANAVARARLAEHLPEAARRIAPLSASPADTLDAVLRIATCLMLGLAAYHAFRRRRHARHLAVAIVVSGLFQALYGAAELIAGRQHIFGYAKQHYLASATGTFINRNHFATFLALALPFALALAMSKRGGRRRGGRLRDWMATLPERLDPLRVTATLATLCLAGGVFLSSSRGGLIAAFAGGTLLLGLVGSVGRRRRVALAFVFLVPALAVSLMSTRAPGERFVGMSDEFRHDAGRPAVWRTGAGIAAAHPLLGTGFGTFDTVFRPHAPPTVKLRYHHAHSDWLQVAIEAGAPGLLAALGLAWAVWRRRPSESDRFAERFRWAALAALAALAVHALIDFPIRIPAIAATAAILVGVVCAGHPPVSARVPRAAFSSSVPE